MRSTGFTIASPVPTLFISASIRCSTPSTISTYEVTLSPPSPPFFPFIVHNTASPEPCPSRTPPRMGQGGDISQHIIQENAGRHRRRRRGNFVAHVNPALCCGPRRQAKKKKQSPQYEVQSTNQWLVRIFFWSPSSRRLAAKVRVTRDANSTPAPYAASLSHGARGRPSFDTPTSKPLEGTRVSAPL